MKIERLLEIIFYLLAHKKATSQQLAQHFSVSVRTIQRDIESLILAGIPIMANTGRNGGYEILDDFKLARPLINSSDYAQLIAALTSLNTAIDDTNLTTTLGKLLAVQAQEKAVPTVMVDFSIAKENPTLIDLLKLLKEAINSQQRIKFCYHGHKNFRKVEPIALNYRWYAWYLLAFDCEKEDFRIFKLVRMDAVQKMPEPFRKEITNLPAFIEEQWGRDQSESLKIRLFCQANTRADISEYFRANILEIKENGDFTCDFFAVKTERLWFSLLLGFGDSVKVLEPIEVAEDLQKIAQKIIKNYS